MYIELLVRKLGSNMQWRHRYITSLAVSAHFIFLELGLEEPFETQSVFVVYDAPRWGHISCQGSFRFRIDVCCLHRGQRELKWL